MIASQFQMKSELRSSHIRHNTRRVIRVTRKDGTSYSYVRKSGLSRVSAVPAVLSSTPSTMNLEDTGSPL